MREEEKRWRNFVTLVELLRLRSQVSIFIISAFTCWFPGGAITPVYGESKGFCDRLVGPQDVIQCALENHPDIVQAQATLAQSDSLEGIAKQRPNPELSTKLVYGNSSGDTLINAEANLAHVFELGDKRSARIEKTEAERKGVAAQVLSVQEQVYLDTLLALYRISQIFSELDAVQDALETFLRIRNQYLLRPKLSPEQQASLRIFEIALGDYALKKVPLEVDLDRLKREIEFSIGREFQLTRALLPKRKEKWPTLLISELRQPPGGSHIESFRATLWVSQADLSVAQSNSWPDIRFGPSISKNTQGPFTYTAYGVNLSLTLPLFHLNGAQRSHAQLGIEKAERNLSAHQKETADQREHLFYKYQQTTQALQSSWVSTQTQMVQKHREVESLFRRGLLPGPLLIELHRQALDFKKIQSEQELAAIDALARFYAIQGRLLGEKIE